MYGLLEKISKSEKPTTKEQAAFNNTLSKIYRKKKFKKPKLFMNKYLVLNESGYLIEL